MRLVITLAGLSLLPSLLVGQARPQGAPAKPEVKEWEVLYGAQTRPRDPYADAKGGVWFVGQSGNYIGYLDSGSGEFRRYECQFGIACSN